MRFLRLFSAFWAMALLVACVSTSSGPKELEADDEEAAIQYYELGARYYRNGNYEFARDRLERALEFDPKMGIAHSTLALTFIQLENPRLAKEHYQQAVRVEPKNVDVRNAYAVYLCQLGEYAEARKQFDRAIADYTNDNAEVMLTNAGVCMVNKPDYELAEDYFRRALEFKASYSEALLQLSSLYFETKDCLRARAFVQRYLATNMSSAPVLFLASQIERCAGDDRAATDYVNQLLREHPDSREAQYLINSR